MIAGVMAQLAIMAVTLHARIVTILVSYMISVHYLAML